MGSESTPLLRSGQFRLRALLAATAVAGVLLALGRWAGSNREALELARASPGALPTEWALVLEAMALALMIAFAAGRHRLRSLFFSKESMTLLGGVSMLTSGFFRYMYGPWAVNLSLYEFLTWNLSLSGLPMLLSASPMVYGAITAALSTTAIVAERTTVCRWRWTLAALFLGIVALAEVALLWWPGAWWPDLSTWITALVMNCLVLASLAATVGLVRDGDRKIRLMNLFVAALIIRYLIPSATINGVAIPLSDLLRSMGPGYWLLALGAVLILINSIALLWSTRGTRSRGFEHRAQDTRM
ncbi:MAG: hypothetical protein ACHRXM_28650 [Isosphaerales bacterium]